MHGISPAAGPPELALVVGRERFRIRCDPDVPAALLEALLALLPMRADLHCPKIAGHHIYWPVPVLFVPQSTSDVMTMHPGTCFFWPERQMVEIAYAPLQAESARVCRIGRVIGGAARLAALGTRVRRRQGRRPCFATVALLSPPSLRPPAKGSVLPALAQARALLWAECPAEISALLAGRDVMHPAGPLFFAESETRLLHEGLWWLRSRLAGDAALYPAARIACEKAAARLSDFCRLSASAEPLATAAGHMGEGGERAAAALDEAVLIAGRLSSWLDFMIPWEAVNRAVRRAADGPRKHHLQEAAMTKE